MSEIQCFKIKNGTNYDKAVKQHFELMPKWKHVYDKVSRLLNENITKLGYDANGLLIDVSELTKDENKKLFTKNGMLKRNLKKAQLIQKEYLKIIEEEGLSEYQNLRHINFKYGIFKLRGQELESYRTSDNDIYYKADFDLEKKTRGLVEPISHIAYEEKYLEELKKQEQNAK